MNQLTYNRQTGLYHGKADGREFTVLPSLVGNKWAAMFRAGLRLGDHPLVVDERARWVALAPAKYAERIGSAGIRFYRPDG